MDTQEFLKKLAALVDQYEGDNQNGIAHVVVWPVGTDFFSEKQQLYYGWNGSTFEKFWGVFPKPNQSGGKLA